MLSRDLLKTVLFSLALLILAAAADGLMDKLQFRYSGSVFEKRAAAHRQWLDPRLSWHNKWKNGDPKQGEAFPLSSSALVGLTDAWHALKSLAISCVILAFILPFCKLLPGLPWTFWVGVFFALHLLYGAVFELMFARC